MLRMFPSSIPSSKLTLLMCFTAWCLVPVACGGQDEAPEEVDSVILNQSDDEVRKMGKADDIKPPMDSVIEEPFVEPSDRYPLFETVRYVNQYEDCKEPFCMTDMRFALRGGTVAYYQRGMMVRNIPLLPEDRDKLRALVGRDSELGQLLFSEENIPCELIDERRIDHNVELELAVYVDSDTREYYQHTISHCSANSIDEVSDEFVAFIQDVTTRY